MQNNQNTWGSVAQISRAEECCKRCCCIESNLAMPLWCWTTKSSGHRCVRGPIRIRSWPKLLRSSKKKILHLNWSNLYVKHQKSCLFCCKLCLKLWLIQRNPSTKAPWGNLTMCWGELCRQYNIIMRVQRTDHPQGTGFFGQTVNKFTALFVKSQQSNPIAMWRRNHSPIRAEAKFFDITPAYIGFFNVMSQSKRTTRWDRSYRSSFLEFIDTSPLEEEKRDKPKL